VTAGDATPASPDIASSTVPPDDWEGLLASTPMAEYSHTAHWLTAAGRTVPGVQPRFWTARLDGRLVGGLGAAVYDPAGMIHRGRQFSSLEGTSGGPLVAADLPHAVQEDVFLALAEAFAGHLRPGFDSCSLVLSPASEARFGPLIDRSGNWGREEVPTAAVDLTCGFEGVENNRIGKNKRNERNRGLRRGVEAQVTRDPDLLAAYYPLHLAACRVWGIAPTPQEFLRDVLDDPTDRVFFSCATLEGQVIGGHLCLHYGDRILAWHGVTDPAFARTHFPATVLVCTDLEEACRRGARWLDLGGSGGQVSLDGFKKFFGAETQMRGLYRRDTAAIGLMRRVRGWLAGSSGTRGGRWHDKRPKGRGA
jgi:hypothetical protein